MPRALPPLDLFRGFEAAARHLSFTRAAAELFLTQSAVSRQVQALEEQLGVALFERRHREIRLTEAGQALYRTSAEVMRALTDAVARARGDAARHALTVSCSIGFASLWLVPRLVDFRARHPQVDIRIDANNRLLELERERVELAVRYCPVELAPPGARKLFGEEVFPVCSPALPAPPDRPLAEPADLRHHTLLHYQAAERVWPTGAWRFWLEVTGLPGLQGASSLEFNQYDQLIQAAVEGQGVALGTSPLVRRHLQHGRLVAPFGQRYATPRAYFLVQARFAADRPDVQAFTAWMLDAARGEAGPA